MGALVAVRRRRSLNLTRLQATSIAACAPGFVAASLEPGRARRAATWAAQMWAYKLAFEIPHDRRDELRGRLRIDYPIRSDTILGFGAPPGQRLQGALRHPPDLTLLDWIAALYYATWEAEPHLVLLWILLKHPRDFPRAAARLALTFDSTLLGYWLVPTAPPWWSSEKAGRMDGEVHRVAVEAKRALTGKDRPASDHEQGANPWAAMPSDHFATALATALVVAEINPAAGRISLAYALLLGLDLVYLGEHYVTDLLAGAAVAIGARAAEPRLRALGRTISHRWPHA